MNFDYKPLFIIPEGIESRWISPENFAGAKGVAAQKNHGRKGSPCFPMKPGESRVLADVTGTSGTIWRIWVTIHNRSPRMLRGLRLDFYWDGVLKPSFSVPFGDFFGHGLGRATTFESALFTSPEGRSFNCYIPMPFRKGFKIVATNESDEPQEALYYDIDYTIGDKHPADVLYFHAHYRRENPTTMQKDYHILPKLKGKGRFLGTNIGVIANMKLYFKAWWGEGEVKVYLDGDKEFPTLCGTGTEDYIGTGWGQGQYAHLYQGCHLADHDNFQYCFYRYHVPEPVYFHKDIRVTIQQIGCWTPDSKPLIYAAGTKIVQQREEGLVEVDLSPNNPNEYGGFERQDDWSSCAYFYLDSPENQLGELDTVEKRVAGLTGNIQKDGLGVW